MSEFKSSQDRIALAMTLIKEIAIWNGRAQSNIGRRGLSLERDRSLLNLVTNFTCRYIILSISTKCVYGFQELYSCVEFTN